jgi:hypothetical protein
MGSLIPRLILIGLAASVSPVAVMILISVLAKKHAKRNSLIWLIGFTLTLLALGFLVVYIFHVGGSGGTSKVDGYIDMGLGALCLLLIPLSVLRKKKPEGPKVESDISPFRALTLGCISMIVNTSTLVIFFSGLHVISAARLETYETGLSVAVLTFFTLTTVLIPIAIYFLFPTKSEKALDAFKNWLMKHKKIIGVAILLVFGVYLLVKGLKVVI